MAEKYRTSNNDIRKFRGRIFEESSFLRLTTKRLTAFFGVLILKYIDS